MFILKGFKFNDLELVIPKKLQAYFLEVRILKDLCLQKVRSNGDNTLYYLDLIIREEYQEVNRKIRVAGNKMPPES